MFRTLFNRFRSQAATMHTGGTGYHLAERQMRDSIAQHGLLAYATDDSSDAEAQGQDAGVYVFVDRDYGERWWYRSVAYDVWAVDLDGLQTVPDRRLDQARRVITPVTSERIRCLTR